MLVPDGIDQGADIFLFRISIKLDVQPTVARGWVKEIGDLIKKHDIDYDYYFYYIYIYITYTDDITRITIACVVSK